jgi:adenylylsulfate kinase-like enzyme
VTGIDSPYEPPESPEIHLRTEEPADVLAERVLQELGRVRPLEASERIAVDQEVR